MMTSSNGNIFRVIGPLCGEFMGQWWISHTKASDAELCCFLWSVPESRSLWRHCNVITTINDMKCFAHLFCYCWLQTSLPFRMLRYWCMQPTSWARLDLPISSGYPDGMSQQPPSMRTQSGHAIEDNRDMPSGYPDPFVRSNRITHNFSQVDHQLECRLSKSLSRHIHDVTCSSTFVPDPGSLQFDMTTSVDWTMSSQASINISIFARYLMQRKAPGRRSIYWLARSHVTLHFGRKRLLGQASENHNAIMAQIGPIEATNNCATGENILSRRRQTLLCKSFMMTVGMVLPSTCNHMEHRSWTCFGQPCTGDNKSLHRRMALICTYTMQYRRWCS